MNESLIDMRKDVKGDFVVTNHPALDPIKAEFPDVFRIVTVMLLDFAVVISRWEEERGPLEFKSADATGGAT